MLANWPIRRKLYLLTASAALIALVLTCLVCAALDVWRFHSAKVEQVTALADILGSNATSALEFSDVITATEVLSSLRLQPSIEQAALFDAQGRRFATYPARLSDDESELVPAVAAEFECGGVQYTGNNHLVIMEGIHRDGDKVGSIFLRSNLREIYQRLIQTVWALLAITVVALGVSTLLTGRLQRFFTVPISELTQTMERIAVEDDYSLRVRKHGRDEFGTLCDGFNTMLAQIAATRDALQHAQQKAEQANRAKSEFLANMSHEIRSPMTAILGFAETLLDDSNEPRTTEAVDTIRRNGEYLLGIINDILDLSRIESNGIQVETAACSPIEIVAAVALLMRTPAAAKNLSLEIKYAGPIPRQIQSDPTRLRQILINLVANAVKFTEVGGIRLVVRLLNDDLQPPRLKFDVIDTGIGMTEHQISKIFRPFTQADNSTTRRFGGSGLGLTISQRLARLLGGDIVVRSIAGKGSTFSLTIATGPVDQVPMVDRPEDVASEQVASSKPPRAEKVRLSCRVLLVEDGRDNQRLIAFLLKKAGAEVVVADNGQVGVELALTAEGVGKPFDVILMDMQMPVLDGYEATRTLRSEGLACPVVALTAHAMEGDRQKCLDAGCDDYMTKPIERKKLLAMVAKHLEKQEETRLAGEAGHYATRRE